MLDYRIATVDLPTRISVAVEMLTPRPARGWGRVSELARTYQVSRTLLYEWRAQALTAISAALMAQPAGRPEQISTVVIDRAWIERAIALWPTLTGSVRGVQQGLAQMVGVERSVGYISETLQRVGAAAATYNASMVVSVPILAEADEIFQGRQPCLTVVDGRSFLALNLAPAAARDGTTWGVTLLDLQARGLQFADLASDGGTGILAGVREAGLLIPLRPDLFHLLRESHVVLQRLERKAYQAIELAEHTRRAVREAQAPKRRRGKPLTVKVPLAQAEDQEAAAMRTYDLCAWLLHEVRQALEPFTPAGRLASVAAARTTIQVALELLVELAQPDLTALVHKFAAHLEALLAPLAWLEQQLTTWRTQLEPKTEAFLVWAWQQRRALDIDLATGRGLPAALQPVARAFADALALFHRSSSLAEALHSWLRPHLHIHRGMPQWLLPLLQLAWNHHTFTRGARAGYSPLELAEVEQVPSFTQVIERLLHNQATGQPA